MRRRQGYRERMRGWTAQIISITDDSGGSTCLEPFEHTRGQLRLLPNLSGPEVIYGVQEVELDTSFRTYQGSISKVLVELGVGGFIIWSGDVYSRTTFEREKWLGHLTSHCYLSEVLPDPHKGKRYPEAASLLSSHPQIYSYLADSRFDKKCVFCGTEKKTIQGETKTFCPSCRC